MTKAFENKSRVLKRVWISLIEQISLRFVIDYMTQKIKAHAFEKVRNCKGYSEF
jgi:hypothetical protein